MMTRLVSKKSADEVEKDTIADSTVTEEPEPTAKMREKLRSATSPLRKQARNKVQKPTQCRMISRRYKPQLAPQLGAA